MEILVRVRNASDQKRSTWSPNERGVPVNMIGLRTSRHVMVEKVRPLKRAVYDGKRSAREAERSACGAKGSHAKRN